MMRSSLVSIVLAWTCAGIIAKADLPPSPRPGPAPIPAAGVVPRQDMRATEAKQPAAPATPRRRFFGRLRPSQDEVPPPRPSESGTPIDAQVRVAPAADRPASDIPVRRVQAGPSDFGAPLVPEPILPASPVALEAGQNLSLQSALYGALTSNPDLVSLRQGNVPGNTASPEAVEVARNFPTTLNPTLWVDVRPLIYERVPGGTTSSGRAFGPSLNQKDALMYFSLRQPLELGHQTRYRYAIAKAALNQQRSAVLQAELLALVQTYRFFQTAAYQREKVRVAQQLADFNDQLLVTLKRRLEANQVPADVVALGEIESQASRQLVKAARQAYARALTDLRNQIGIPATAGTAEPLGEFILPAFIPQVEDEALIRTALQSRPEIHAARAQVEGAKAAIGLARGDRIPTPVVGPVYERDENGTQFFGFVYITPIPILNNGMPLVRQREAEYRRANVALQQIQQRTAAQVKAAVANWNQANEVNRDTLGLTEALRTQVSNLEKLFEAGQTDVSKLLQGRQRLIQLENAQLDATWQATQAQADLLTALGAPTLINALERAATTGDSAGAASPMPPDPTSSSPFRPGAGSPAPAR